MSRVTREPKKAGLDRVKGMNSNWDNKCWDKIPRNRKALSLISRCGDLHRGEEQSECSAWSSLSLPPPGCRSTRTILDFNHLKKGAQHGSFFSSRYHLVSDWSSEASESRHSSIVFFLRYFCLSKSFTFSLSYNWQVFDFTAKINLLTPLFLPTSHMLTMSNVTCKSKPL